jgi:hypothetical protein
LDEGSPGEDGMEYPDDNVGDCYSKDSWIVVGHYLVFGAVVDEEIEEPYQKGEVVQQINH